MKRNIDDEPIGPYLTPGEVLLAAMSYYGDGVSMPPWLLRKVARSQRDLYVTQCQLLARGLKDAQLGKRD